MAWYEDLPDEPTVIPKVLAESWLPADIDAAFDAGLEMPSTTVLERKDGLNLFYPGRLHSLVGESGSLKTWVSLLAVQQEMQKGNRVIFLDYEDNLVSILDRLVKFGFSREEIKAYFIYVQPDAAISDPAKEYYAALIPATGSRHEVTLVVIDGVTEVMQLEGLKIIDQEDIAAFYRRFAKWFAQLGPAVVQIDHVTKSKDTRGKDAIGGQHKRSGIDGASYLVELSDPFAHGKHGKSYLKLAKDKNGTVQAKVDRMDVGTFHIVSDPASHSIEAWIDLPHTVTVLPVPTAGSKSLSATPAQIQLILDYVKDHNQCSRNPVPAAVGMDRNLVYPLMLQLAELGFMTSSGGKLPKFTWTRDYDIPVVGLEDL